MATCFLCETPMVPRFRTRDHMRPEVLTEFQVDWCDACDFGRVAGTFTPEEVADFYTENYYTHVTAGELDKPSMPLLDRLRVHLAWRTDRGVDLSPSEVEPVQLLPTLCDVGCGSGQAMTTFKKAGYDVVGIEPDPSARALAAQIGRVYEGTAEALPADLEGREFDVVLLSHVLEHCVDPAVALRNVKRLLAWQGTAVIEVPNSAVEGFEMYGPGWFFADIPRHLQFFTEGSLRKALNAVELSVTKVMYTGYTRQFSNGWLAAQQTIRAQTGLEATGEWEGNVGRLLATTAFAPPARKYDSIRIHAVHRG